MGWLSLHSVPGSIPGPCMHCWEDGIRNFLFSLYSPAAQRGSRFRFQPQLPHFLGVSGGISIFGPQYVISGDYKVFSDSEAVFQGLCCLVPQSYPALCDPMDCSPPDSSVHGILQARILDCHSLLHPRSRDGKVL